VRFFSVFFKTPSALSLVLSLLYTTQEHKNSGLLFTLPFGLSVCYGGVSCVGGFIKGWRQVSSLLVC